MGDPSQMELASSPSSASDAIRGRGVGAVGGDQVIFGAPEIAKSAYRWNFFLHKNETIESFFERLKMVLF